MPGKVRHRGAVHRQRHLLDEVLGQLHQVVIVGVGLVELEHGELRIVLGRNTFVTKVAIDLIDPVQTAHHQPLQIEFGRDTQVQRQIQRIMVSAKGPGGCSSGDGLHHRGLHLDVSALIEESSNRLEHLGPLDEDRAHIGVHEQIHVTLAVAKLYVGQAVILLRQGEHGLGQEGHLLDVDCQFAGAGAEDIAGNSDVVAQIEQLVELKTLFSYRIQADVDL